MVSPKIVNLSKEDWKTYKELRLLSLKDSPDSFGSTYEEEISYPDLEWAARIDKDGRNKSSLPIFKSLPIGVTSNRELAGLAWGIVHSPEDKTAHVYQMWVCPTARGQGLGKLLLSHIIEWARTSGLVALELSVTTTNREAKNLYQSAGFLASGELEELRKGSPLLVQPMKLELRDKPD